MSYYHLYNYTVQKFYRLLEQKDLKNWMKLWARDAKNIFPYSNCLMPDILEGVDAIQQFWSSAPQMYARLSFPVSDIYTKPYKAIAFFESHHLVKDHPHRYEDCNIGVFEFNNRGKIKCYTEYFDPINLGQTHQFIHISKLS